MPERSQELFRLAAATPEGAFLRGRALAYASAEAHASFRRGIDLSASTRFDAQVSGEFGSGAAAVLSAGAEGSAWLALQAAIPLDLFDSAGGAGLLVRFRAQAAIAAYVGASLQLRFDEFERLLDDRVDGPLERLLDIFLEEAVAEAGVWGRVSFSAEAYGEMIVAGSLLPAALGGAGFTLSAQFGAGVGLGAGAQFLANIGFEDPARLLERLADTTAELILAEAERYLVGLGTSEAPAVQQALDLARILVPLASKSVFRLGLELVHSGPDGPVRAAQAIADSFVRQAQEIVLNAVGDLAFRKLGELLDTAGVTNHLANFGADQREQVGTILEDLRDDLVGLGSTDWLDVDVWLPSLTQCFETFDGLLAIGILPDDVTEGLRRPLATVWSAALVAQRIISLGRTAAGGRPEEDPLGTAPLSTPVSGSTAEYVAHALGRSADTEVTAADLVTFLIGVDPLAELRRSLPELAGTIDWLATATQSTPERLMETLLVVLARPDGNQIERLLATVGTALGDAVEQSLIPSLLEPLKSQDPANESLRLLIDELVSPALVAFPSVVLPQLAHLGDDDAKLRLREALSAVLLQSVGRFVVAGGEVLLTHALDNCEIFLREMATSMVAGGQPAALALVESSAARAGLPAPGAEVVAGMLDLSADVVAVLKSEDDAIVALANQTLGLSLGVAASRLESFQTLVSSDAPPRRQDLEAVLAQVQNATWDAFAHVGSELLETLAQMVAEQAAIVAEAIDRAARTVVVTAIEAAEWLGQQLAELERTLANLARQVTELGASIAGATERLAAHLRGKLSEVVESVRSAGRTGLESLVADFPDWAREAIFSLYDALFDGVRWLVETPLRILESVGSWVREVLESRLDVTTHDEVAVRQEVTRRIHESVTGDVHFDLALEAFGVRIFDAGRVTIPGGVVGGAVAESVVADKVFNETVRSTADTAVRLQAVRSQQATLQARLSDRLDHHNAVADAKRLLPQQPLAVQFLSPAPNAVVAAPGVLRVLLQGANRTFAEPTLGVPPRVTVAVNGQEWLPSAENWKELAGGLELTLTLTLDPPRRPVSSNARVVLGQPLAQAQHEVAVRLEQDSDMRLVMAGRQPVVMRPSAASTGTTPATAAAFRRSGDGTVLAGSGLSPRTRAQLLAAASAATDHRAEGDADRPDAGSTQVRGVGAATIAARGDRSGLAEPVARKPGASAVVTDKQGRVAVPAKPGVNIVQVAVSDGQGRKSSAAHIVVLQPAVVVQVEPDRIIIDRESEVIVRAVDPRSGREVGTGQGRVLVDGVEVGHLGQRFRYTFRQRRHEELDPEPQPGGKPGRVLVTWTKPEGTIHLTGYASARIPFAFSDPVPDRDAGFVSMAGVPAKVQTGQRFSVTVRMRNTGGLPWRAQDGFRLGSQNPTDQTAWGLARVELGASVAPGQEAAFSFTVTAPLKPGVHHFQWQMVQDGVAWFGERTSDVAVEVSQPTMTVRVEPATIVLEREVEVTVRAYDARSGSEVGAGEGRVVVDGVEVGRVGRAFRYTFRRRRHEELDPEPQPGGKPRPVIVTWLDPVATVSVSGYAPTRPRLHFAPPVPDRAARFVGQYPPPARMQAGQRHQVSVRMRNTGWFTWNAKEGFRLGSQNPSDHTAWGFARVELAHPVPAGQEATFSFTVTAPKTGGVHHFRWRMVQDGVTWFGDATPDVAVDVWVPEPAECPELRRQISQRRDEIVLLQDGLEGAGPRERTVFQRRLGAARAELQRLETRAREIGCRP